MVPGVAGDADVLPLSPPSPAGAIGNTHPALHVSPDNIL